MEIAMIMSNNYPPEEGIGHYTTNLSKNLTQMGHDVSIITRGKGLNLETFESDGLNIYKAPFIPIYPIHVHIHKFFIEKLIKSINVDFDAIHIHSPLSPPITSKTPIISTIHTSLVEDLKHFQVNNLDTLKINLTTKVAGYPLTKKLIEKSKFTTTVSSAVAEELTKYYGIKDPIVIGNGVDEKFFIPNEGIKEKNIIYVGRLDYRKGIVDLMEICKYLKKQHVKIIIVGDGPLKPYIENHILKNNLKNVLLVGKKTHEELVKLYQSSSMFLFPSHYEGLPTVLLEAMSSGLVPVISNIPAHKDVIKNFENGFLIDINNHYEFAEKINYLLENPDLIKKMGNEARKTIENKYTWNLIAKKLENIYKTVKM